MHSEMDVVFAAALLAGGQSRRMGRDKAWLDWHGQPLWEAQLLKLEELHPARLLLSCRDEQQLAFADAEMLPDPSGNQGPLPALARCLAHAQMPLLALAVDMPHVTVAFLREMIRLAARTERGVIYQGSHGYEPLCAVYPPAVLPLLRQTLEEGNLRLQVFAQQAVEGGWLNVIPLSKEQEGFFLNLNTPADLPS